MESETYGNSDDGRDSGAHDFFDLDSQKNFKKDFSSLSSKSMRSVIL